MSLDEIMVSLRKQGCYPSLVYRGGGVWRAHVNWSGNFWDEASTPFKAIERAYANWVKAGKPLDGAADK